MNDLTTRFKAGVQLVQQVGKSGKDVLQKGMGALSDLQNMMPQAIRLKKKNLEADSQSIVVTPAVSTTTVVSETDTDEQVKSLVDKACEEMGVDASQIPSTVKDEVKQHLFSGMDVAGTVGELLNYVKGLIPKGAKKEEYSERSNEKVSPQTEIQRMSDEQLKARVDYLNGKITELCDDLGKKCAAASLVVKQRVQAKFNSLIPFTFSAKSREALETTINRCENNYLSAKDDEDWTEDRKKTAQNDAVRQASLRWWNSGALGRFLLNFSFVQEAHDELKKSTRAYFEAVYVSQQLERDVANNDQARFNDNFSYYDQSLFHSLNQFAYGIIFDKKREINRVSEEVVSYADEQDARKARRKNMEAAAELARQKTAQEQALSTAQGAWDDLVADAHAPTASPIN